MGLELMRHLKVALSGYSRVEFPICLCKRQQNIKPVINYNNNATQIYIRKGQEVSGRKQFSEKEGSSISK